MKTLELTNAKLVSCERRNSSVYGNPAWYVCFDNGTDSVMGKTASNAQCGYTVENFRGGKLANVSYHITNSGNTIIDSISEA